MSSSPSQTKRKYTVGPKKLEAIKRLHYGNLGSRRSAETKERMRKAHLGLKATPAQRFRMSAAQRGNVNNYRDGRHKSRCGYIWIYCPSHPYANSHKYIAEHRLVMERMMGRYLQPEEVVHHINEVRNDNRPENLMLFPTNAAHTAHHHSLKRKKRL